MCVQVLKVKSGQRKGKLTGEQTSQIITVASQSPAERMKSITQCLSQADVLTDPTVREFGLHVTDKMLKIQGRVLPPPVVQYRNQSITPSWGAWNLRDLKLYNAKKLSRWGVVCLLEESRARDPQVCHLPK